MVQDRLITLQNMPIFGGINESILTMLIENARVITRESGEHFFTENAPGISMFILDYGQAVASKSWDGNSFQLFQLGPGDCFGEMELINPSTRAMSVTARTTTQAIEISNKQLLDLYQRDLEQFTLIQMNMGREVCRRLRLLEENLFGFHMGSEVPHKPFIKEPVYGQRI